MSASETSSASIGLSYRDAGVDIKAGNALVGRIKSFVKYAMREGVLGGIGGFDTLFELPNKYQEPVLVSGTDGVGTKLKPVSALNCHDTVGQNLVVMSVSDTLVQDAKLLFLLDYFAYGKLGVDAATTVAKGITQGCELAGRALIGGKTAEMSSMHPDGEYDLAGFAVGAVEKRKIIDDTTTAEGDVVLGLVSPGAHSNGYPLVRKIIEMSRPDLNADLHDQRLQDAIMALTRIHVKSLLSLIDKLTVKGMAYITGSGLTENVPCVLQDNLIAVLHKDAWALSSLSQWLQKAGNVVDDEMYRVFNCGIGMVVIVSLADAPAVVAHLKDAGEAVHQIDEIRARQAGEAQTIVI